MSTGVVIIGRNEGERLRRCLNSVMGKFKYIIYVDSGSTDGSVSIAKRHRVTVINLDPDIPFSAARGRNEGFYHLIKISPEIKYVQFIDGDCELIDDWPESAKQHLNNNPKHAVVCGRLREKHPEASIYNRLGDMEWNFLGSGEVASVGGVFMIRCSAFVSVGGFDPTVRAGEEPELCQRLRSAGWIITRVDFDMAWHDLGMTRFCQWWKRQVRNGYGSQDVGKRFELDTFKRNNTRVRFWSAWTLLMVHSSCRR